ncbi:MFS transporter, partial [Staphylococcus aureus]
MVRGIANSKIGFGDLILLLRYFFKLKISTHPNF